jgi:hypothetical protein
MEGMSHKPRRNERGEDRKEVDGSRSILSNTTRFELCALAFVHYLRPVACHSTCMGKVASGDATSRF